MDVREKLVELIENANYQCDNRDCEEDAEGCAYHCYANCWAQFIADNLIANGVMVNEPLTHCQQWIPVTERKPDLELVNAKSDDMDLYPCLVTVKDGRSPKGRYVGKAWYDGEQFIDSDCMYITSDVTHWMPLPEPPKGE